MNIQPIIDQIFPPIDYTDVFIVLGGIGALFGVIVSVVLWKK